MSQEILPKKKQLLNQNAETLIKDYLTWYEGQISFHLFNQAEEVVTPFKTPLNDQIRIYIEPQDDGTIKISDDRFTLSELMVMGINVNTDINQRVIHDIAYQFGLDLGDYNNLSITTNKAHFPQAKLNLIQGILAIYGLAYKP